MNKFTFRDRDLVYRARDLRKKDLIPGVIFGPNIKTMPIMAKRRELLKAIEASGEVYEVPLRRKKILVKIGEIQREPVSGRIIHFSLVQMPKGELSQIDVPLRLLGIPEGTKKGGNLVVLRPEIKVKGKPSLIPKFINGSVEKLNIGESLTIADLNLPTNIEILEEESEVVAICQAPVQGELETPIVGKGFEEPVLESL